MWKPRKRAQLYYPRGICTFSSSHIPSPLLLSRDPIKLSSRTQLKGLLLQDDFPDCPTSKSWDSSCAPPRASPSVPILLGVQTAPQVPLSRLGVLWNVSTVLWAVTYFSGHPPFLAQGLLCSRHSANVVKKAKMESQGHHGGGHRGQGSALPRDSCIVPKAGR